MKGEEVPSLTDKEWSSKNELGSITEEIEYSIGEGKKAKVNVTATIISGEESEAIEAECSEIDYSTEEVNLDREKFTMKRFCRIFGIDEDTYRDIMKNKSDDLRNKLMLLAARCTGSSLSDEEIELEKKSVSPVS